MPPNLPIVIERSMGLDLLFGTILAVLSFALGWRAIRGLADEEIRAIADDSLPKSLFIMPPSKTSGQRTESDTWVSGMTRRDRWVESIAELPIELPDYSEEGAILRFSHTCAPASVLPYNRKTILGLVQEHCREGIPLERVVQRLHSKGLLTIMLNELERRSDQLTS